MEITRCSNIQCQMRFHCYRYLKMPEQGDGIRSFQPRDRDFCWDFVQNSGSDGVRSSHEADMDNVNRRYR